MTDTTQKLITQLRTLQQLTNTEAQARLRPGSGCSRRRRSALHRNARTASLRPVRVG